MHIQEERKCPWLGKEGLGRLKTFQHWKRSKRTITMIDLSVTSCRKKEISGFQPWERVERTIMITQESLGAEDARTVVILHRRFLKVQSDNGGGEERSKNEVRAYWGGTLSES